VWLQIEAAYPTNMRTFTNDWQDSSINASWKVASGMYLPTYHTDAITIMTRNDNWWGQAVFGKLPQPKYIQHTRYFYSNAPAALDLQNNGLDICGNFIPGIGTIMGSFPQINTYDPDPPYYAETSIKLLVPNHRNYPLDANWLHWAIAEALDYSGISAVSCGYLKVPPPGEGYSSDLLPSDDTVAKALVNATLEQQYAIHNNLTAANEILNQYCTKIDNVWYTKDSPTREWIEKYVPDDVDLTIGTVRHPASQWNATYPTSLDEADQLPSTVGINVRLGPWTIMDQQGWSDLLAIDAIACSMIKNGLGIDISQKVVDWGTNEADGHSFNYDFMHFVMHTSTGTMYDRYFQMFVGTDYYWNHYGDYRNTTFTELIRQLDITAGAAQQAVADQILTIIGQEMPLIPFGGHPNWYQYNAMYWLGFSNKATNPILPAGPFGGTATSALLQTMVLGLTANPEAETPPIVLIESPQNTICATATVQLSFTVDKPTSWLGYSLNGQANVTITGNTTLTIPDGSHTIVVYAEDTLGNMGSSNTVHFTVDAAASEITSVTQMPLPNNVLPEDEVEVNATILDGTSGVKQVTLVYAYANDSGAWIESLNMSFRGRNIWNATIPAFPYGTRVTYTVMAQDKAGNTVNSEELGYECQYQVIPEFPSSLILSLFMSATLLAITVYKRKRTHIT